MMAIMARAVCIFSDGTGQAGGANPVDWTSVYRLFVNTRDIDPARQICFYDPGIGSDPDQGEEAGLVTGLGQWLAKALGAGITRNIVDGYAALLVTWQPGDRIFLFGFSRGAYTVRSVAGVLGLCGIPPGLPKVSRWQDVHEAVRQPGIRAIAEEAVREVYMIYDDRAHRLAKADAFRSAHRTHPLAPFFVGVWDTVRALGWQVTDIANFGRHRFHDAILNPAIDHGRQVLSVDENRKVFAPELWDERSAPAGQIRQIWMAGVHADIGGGYGLKRGLTDLAMKWMVDEAVAARDRVVHASRSPGFAGLRVDPELLNELNLDPLAGQHDERGTFAGKLWWPGTREAYVAAPELAGTARTADGLPPRFAAEAVPIDGRMEPYRPEALRLHPLHGHHYLPAAPGGPDGP
jgi:uncharacterized protein (DUF2235 family)